MYHKKRKFLFMGQQPSIDAPLNVLDYENACSLAPFIQSVTGRSGATMSSSDQWLIHLRPNILHYHGKPLNHLFVKIVPNNYKPVNPVSELYLTRLQYEIKVYAEVIKPILDKKICPFFLPVINVTYNCSAQSLIDMLTDKAPAPEYKKPDRASDPFNPTQVFVRNMTFSLFQYLYDGPVEKRKIGMCFDPQREMKLLNMDLDDDFLQDDFMATVKSFTTGEDTVPLLDRKNLECVSAHAADILYNINYTLLITEPVFGSTTFYNYIRTLLKQGNIANLYLLYFETSIAFSVMYWSKLFHQDLHLGNILIKQLPKTESFLYRVENMVYTYHTNVIPYVFDYDRSELKRYHENFEEENLITDLVPFFLNCWVISKRDDNILHALFIPEAIDEAREYFEELYTRSKQENPNLIIFARQTMDINFFMDIMFEYNEIIDNWAKLSGLVTMSSHRDAHIGALLESTDHQYFYSSSFFNIDTGELQVLDPFSMIYKAPSPLEVQNTQAILAKKQVLAQNELEILQLQFELHSQ